MAESVVDQRNVLLCVDNSPQAEWAYEQLCNTMLTPAVRSRLQLSIFLEDVTSLYCFRQVIRCNYIVSARTSMFHSGAQPEFQFKYIHVVHY